MLIEGIVAAVVVLALAVGAAHPAALARRRALGRGLPPLAPHPRAHQRASRPSRAQEGSAHPESAVRVGGTPSVRVTDGRGAVPPVRRRRCRSRRPGDVRRRRARRRSDRTRPAAHRDKAMSSMNHRPRRLAAPALAVAAVIVLVIVLLVTGAHKVAPPGHHHSPSTDSKAVAPPSRPSHDHDDHDVDHDAGAGGLPAAVQHALGATYEVSGSEFTLALSATSGACWVDVTNSGLGIHAVHRHPAARGPPDGGGHRTGHPRRRGAHRARRLGGRHPGRPAARLPHAVHHALRHGWLRRRPNRAGGTMPRASRRKAKTRASSFHAS